MTENITSKQFEEIWDSIVDEIRVEDLKYRSTTNLENETELQGHSSLPPILTLEETALYLKVSKATAYELIKQKGFPVFYIGKMIRVNAHMLEEWIQKQCTEQWEVA